MVVGVENRTLELISFIDPNLVSKSTTVAVSKLLQLPDVFTNVLKGQEVEEYEKEVRLLCSDPALPPVIVDKKEVECYSWWKSLGSYPTVVKMVEAVLSIFHGPRVESSFSMMSDIIDPKSGRMNIETYDALQTVKYSLLANKVHTF